MNKPATVSNASGFTVSYQVWQEKLFGFKTHVEGGVDASASSGAVRGAFDQTLQTKTTPLQKGVIPNGGTVSVLSEAKVCYLSYAVVVEGVGLVPIEENLALTKGSLLGAPSSITITASVVNAGLEVHRHTAKPAAPAPAPAATVAAAAPVSKPTPSIFKDAEAAAFWAAHGKDAGLPWAALADALKWQIDHLDLPHAHDTDAVRVAVQALKGTIDDDGSGTVSAHELARATNKAGGLRALLAAALENAVAAKEATPTKKAASSAAKSPGAPKAATAGALSFDCPALEPLVPGAKVELGDRALHSMSEAELSALTVPVLTAMCRDRFPLSAGMDKTKASLVKYLVEFRAAFPADQPIKKEVDAANAAAVAKQSDDTWRSWDDAAMTKAFTADELKHMCKTRGLAFKASDNKATLIGVLRAAVPPKK